MNSTRIISARRASLKSRLVKMTKLGLMAFCLAGLMLLPAFAQTTRNWTGANSANWSDPGNWSPTGMPQNGDTLQFGFVNDSHQSMVNDVAGLSIRILEFTQKDYQLDGNSITMNSSIFNDSNHSGINGVTHTTTINCPLVFPWGGEISTGGENGNFSESTADLHLNGPLEVDNDRLSLTAFSIPSDPLLHTGGGNAHLYISGVVSGNGDLLASADETDGHVSPVVFDGTPGNIFTGTLFLSMQGNSLIVFNKSSGSVATNQVAVTDGSLVSLQLGGPNQIANYATIYVADDSELDLSGNNVTVGTLNLGVSGGAFPAILDTGSTTVGLNVGITSSASDTVHPIIRGKINLNGFLPFNISGGPQPGLEVSAVIEGVGFDKTGNGELLLDGSNTFTGDLQIDAGLVVPTTAAALSPTSAGVVMNGGKLQITSLAIGAEPLIVDSTNSTLITYNTCSWAGPVTLNSTFNVLPTDLTMSGLTMNFSG